MGLVMYTFFELEGISGHVMCHTTKGAHEAAVSTMLLHA